MCERNLSSWTHAGCIWRYERYAERDTKPASTTRACLGAAQCENTARPVAQVA